MTDQEIAEQLKRLRDEARFGWHLAANRQMDTRDLHTKAADTIGALSASLKEARAGVEDNANKRIGWSLQLAHAVDAFNLTDGQKHALKELSDAIAENRA